MSLMNFHSAGVHQLPRGLCLLTPVLLHDRSQIIHNGKPGIPAKRDGFSRRTIRRIPFLQDKTQIDSLTHTTLLLKLISVSRSFYYIVSGIHCQVLPGTCRRGLKPPSTGKINGLQSSSFAPAEYAGIDKEALRN